VLHVDARASAVALIGPDLGAGECKFRAVALAGDGPLAFCPPCNHNQVLKIDTREKIVDVVGPELCYGGFKFYCAVSGEDGRVYCPPWNGTKILCVRDPGDDAERDFELLRPDLGPGGGKYRAVVVGPDDYYLCVPWVAQNVLRMDTGKGIYETLLPKHGTQRDKWAGGAFGRLHTLYCPPYDASKVLNVAFNDFSAEAQKKNSGAA